jgi:hypothetical protein
MKIIYQETQEDKKTDNDDINEFGISTHYSADDPPDDEAFDEGTTNDTNGKESHFMKHFQLILFLMNRNAQK